MLAKGPVALALTVVPLVTYQLWDEAVVRLQLLPWLMYGAVLSLLAAPWFLLVAMRDITDAVEFLLENPSVNGANLPVDGGWLLR